MTFKKQNIESLTAYVAGKSIDDIGSKYGLENIVKLGEQVAVMLALNPCCRTAISPVIDWTSEVMVYSIWPDNTNDVTFESWEPPTDGTGTLNIGWAGIEILYPESYPALIHTVETRS